MKEIIKERIDATLKKMRLRLVMSYFGHSNNLRISSFLQGKVTNPSVMTDEELIIIHQLIMAAENGIIDEIKKRDILPDELKQMDTMATQMAQQEAKQKGGL